MTVTNNDGATHPGGNLWGDDAHNPKKNVILGGPLAPKAELYYSQTVSVGGFGYSLFQIHYHDTHRIDLGSLGNQNLVITGPGYSMTAYYFGTFGGTTQNDVYAFYGFYPPGGSWDSADNGAYSISLVSKQVSSGIHYAVAANLGNLYVNIKAASISGFIFNDLNGDGARQANEPLLVNRYVYIDLRGTGNYAANDPLALSDINGNFAFDGLVAGSYVVRTYLPPGWKQTTSTQSLTFHLFGNSSPMHVAVGEVLPRPVPRHPWAYPLELPTIAPVGSVSVVGDLAFRNVAQDVLNAT